MSAWPHIDIPGAGLLDEHEIDAACWRKRQVTLTTEQLRAVDETAGLCGVCGGECKTPEACELPEKQSRGRAVLLAMAVALGASICGVCIVGYLRAPL